MTTPALQTQTRLRRNNALARCTRPWRLLGKPRGTWPMPWYSSLDRLQSDPTTRPT